MYKLRSVRPGDYAAAERLLGELYEVHSVGRPELYGAVQRHLNAYFFESMLTNEDMLALAAEQDHELVGICIASLLNFSGNTRIKTVCVDQLVVTASHRHRGVGRMLLFEMEKRAKRLGAKRIDLTVWSFNQDAIAFYEKCRMTPQRIIYEKAL